MDVPLTGMAQLEALSLDCSPSMDSNDALELSLAACLPTSLTSLRLGYVGWKGWSADPPQAFPAQVRAESWQLGMQGLCAHVVCREMIMSSTYQALREFDQAPLPCSSSLPASFGDAAPGGVSVSSRQHAAIPPSHTLKCPPPVALFHYAHST